MHFARACIRLAVEAGCGVETEFVVFGEVLAVALETYPRVIPTYDRWIDHYTNRIAYEKAMLSDATTR